jgi:hypothetical protein
MFFRWDLATFGLATICNCNCNEKWSSICLQTHITSYVNLKSDPSLSLMQMADPLTALIHAVQVMNFLKTLILKTIREREKSVDQDRRLSSYTDFPSHNDDPISSNLGREASSEQPSNTCATHGRTNSNFLRTTTLNRLESDTMEKLWSFEKNSNGEEELEYMSGDNSPTYEMGDLENGSRSGYDSGDWLNFRKGVRKLCRHPVFQLNKPAKKNGSLGIVNTRGGGGETWA